MDLPGVTKFQKRVFKAVLLVPEGFVTTYAYLADFINCGSARAVGQALRCNPFAPDVPCHRVIASDLTIGGFQGSRAGEPVKRKLQLLAREGVLFAEDGKLKDANRVFSSKQLRCLPANQKIMVTYSRSNENRYDHI